MARLAGVHSRRGPGSRLTLAISTLIDAPVRAAVPVQATAKAGEGASRAAHSPTANALWSESVIALIIRERRFLRMGRMAPGYLENRPRLVRPDGG